MRNIKLQGRIEVYLKIKLAIFQQTQAMILYKFENHNLLGYKIDCFTLESYGVHI